MKREGPTAWGREERLGKKKGERPSERERSDGDRKERAIESERRKERPNEQGRHDPEKGRSQVAAKKGSTSRREV